MRNRKLTKLIALFDDEEMEDLERFLISPFFNTNQTIVQLFHFYKGHYPDFKDEAFSDVEAWKSLQLNGDFQKSLLNQYVTKLYKLVIQYLDTKLSSQSPSNLATLRSRYFFFEKSSPYFTAQTNKDFEASIKKQPSIGSRDYHAIFLSELSKFNMAISAATFRKEVKLASTIHASLDQYYIIEKLRLAAVIQIQQTIENVAPFEAPLIQEVYLHARKEFENLLPLAQIWTLAFELTSNLDAIDTYEELRSFWKKHLPILSENDNLSIASVINLSSRTIFKHDRNKLNAVFFELYSLGIQHHWHIKQGFIQHRLFNNIVLQALKQKEIVWAKGFIKKYIEHVEEDRRALIKDYNLARISFFEGKHDTCLKLTAQLNSSDFAINLGVKRMRIKTFYETDSFDLLEANLNSLRVFLHRLSAISHRYRIGHQKFLASISTLYAVKIGTKSLQDLHDLKAQFKPSIITAEYDWLVEKIAELEA